MEYNQQLNRINQIYIYESWKDNIKRQKQVTDILQYDEAW